MASDVAEFLKKKFLDNFPQLSADHIKSLLNEIRAEFTSDERFWSPPPKGSLLHFYQLDHALAECQAYKHHTNIIDLKKIFTPFSHHDPKPDLATMLSAIKEQLHKVHETQSPLDLPSFPIITDSSDFHESEDEIMKDEEVKKIVKWLSFENGFKAIGIHGMCGTGKTTLVRKVLSHPDIKQQYETKTLWVDLSDLISKEELDIRVVKEMLLLLNDDPDLLTEEPTDDWLADRLCRKLEAQKYLIVLESVWHWNDWCKNLLFSKAFPKKDNPGCAVIVTSRIKEVTTQLVGEDNLIHLKPWDKEQMKEFVKKHNKEKWGKKIPDEDIDFIASHSHGLPLVAKALSDSKQEHIT